MTRRDFFTSALSLIAIPFIGCNPKDNLRLVEVRLGYSGRWVKTRMALLQIGDRFRLDGGPFEYRVTAGPFQNKDKELGPIGIWSVHARVAE